jgi:hypothetical protein
VESYLPLPPRYSRKCAQFRTGASLPFLLQIHEEEEEEEERRKYRDIQD